MEVTLRIKRYNPDRRQAAFRGIRVDVEPTDRVLDALNQIKWHQDGTLTYRRSCAHGICGSDAMRINGRNRLACKMLMKEFGKKITIEPLIGFAVIKDLVVDMDQFFDGYKSVKPYLIAGRRASVRGAPADAGAARPVRRHHQVHPLRRLHDRLPDHLDQREFRRPGGDRQRARFIFDSRDQGAAERLRILNTQSGVWRCRTIFNCTDACPRDIKVTKTIEEVKRTLLLEQV